VDLGEFLEAEFVGAARAVTHPRFLHAHFLPNTSPPLNPNRVMTPIAAIKH
jgi:hypothetical protein